MTRNERTKYMRTTVTSRQKEVYEYIHARITDGLPPTLREIADFCGNVHVNAIKSIVTSLEGKGYIQVDPFKSRSIRLTGKRLPGDVDVCCPTCGRTV